MRDYVHDYEYESLEEFIAHNIRALDWGDVPSGIGGGGFEGVK